MDDRNRGEDDPLGVRHDAALRRRLRTPAPDVPALAHKLELALDERTGEFFGDEAAMKAMKRDAPARRFGGLTRPPGCTASAHP